MMGALKSATYESPTPIQAGLIPLALEEFDVVGQARTGTGKTAAFVIPILELLELDSRQKNPQALILVPTRELAVQVKEEVIKLSLFDFFSKCLLQNYWHYTKSDLKWDPLPTGKISSWVFVGLLITSPSQLATTMLTAEPAGA